MASPNLNMRDPVLYRILHATHHRTGDTWCIYPMYDWTHGQSRFDRGDHALDLHAGVREPPAAVRLVPATTLGIYHPQQIEFARLNLTYTVMSKRKLLELVRAGHVSGWDDPRMPTICGLRRRGYTPEAIRNFLRADRRGQVRQRDRHGRAGELPPRGPEPARRAGHGGAAAAARW